MVLVFGRFSCAGSCCMGFSERGDDIVVVDFADVDPPEPPSFLAPLASTLAKNLSRAFASSSADKGGGASKPSAQTKY